MVTKNKFGRSIEGVKARAKNWLLVGLCINSQLFLHYKVILDLER